MGMIKPDKHELYAQARAKGMTQAQAYLEAGYQTTGRVAAINASRLETNDRIRNRIAELIGRKGNGIVLTKTYVLEANIENAEKALGRRPVKLTRRIKRGDEFVNENIEVFVYEPAAANQAIRLLGIEIGMYTERKDVKIVNEYANLSDKELAQKMIEVAEQVLLEGPVIEHEEAEDEPS